MVRPQLWVVAGPNGAGKTTLATQRLAARAVVDEFEVVNPDAIAQRLPRIDGRLDERAAGEEAILRRNALVANRTSLAIETTLTGTSALRFIRRAADAGYKTNLIYVGILSAALSYERVLTRVEDGGHDVPMNAVKRRYAKSMANVAQALPIIDRAFFVDNSLRSRRLLLVREDGRVRRLARELPDWFTSAVPAEMRRRPAASWAASIDSPSR